MELITKDKEVKYIVHLLFSFLRPPTFKQSTPSSRTNMKQLLWREQCMENERRRSSQQLPEEGAVAIPSVSVSHVDQAARVQDIPTQVYKVRSAVFRVLEGRRTISPRVMTVHFG